MRNLGLGLILMTTLIPARGAVAPPDPTVVSVMIVYTTAAMNQEGGKEAIEAVAELAVAQTNAAFANSNIPAVVDLVHVEEAVGFQGSGNSNTDLKALVDPADGNYDEIHALRNDYCADLVMLFTQLTNAGGQATLELLLNPSAENEAFGFSVANPKAVSVHTPTHEWGHNFGCGHHDGIGAYPFAHGYVGEAWQTIMSKAPKATYPRILHFSDPAVLYEGQPTGTADANNAEVIRLTKEAIASFRAGPQLACSAGPDVIVTDKYADGTEKVTLKGKAMGCDFPALEFRWYEGGQLLGKGIYLFNYNFSLGTHEVTLEVVTLEEPSLSATDVVKVDVVVNQSPVAVLSLKDVADVDDNGFEAVVLDATESWDPDGSVQGVAWSVDGAPVASGLTSTVEVAVGSHAVEAIVTDDFGWSASASGTITVRGPLRVPVEYPTIQAAVTASKPGDLILVLPGTYTGPGNRNVVVDKHVMIRSEKGAEATILDGSGAPGSYGFQLVAPIPSKTTDPYTTVIEGFTIRNFSAPPLYGGAITVGMQAFVEIRANRLEANSAMVGGAICVFKGGDVTVDRNVIVSNQAISGGGLYVMTSPFLALTNNLIAANVATSGDGGGIYLGSVGHSCPVLNNTIADNHAAVAGGGIYTAGDEIVLDITNTILWGNSNGTGPSSLEGIGESYVSFSLVQNGESLNSDPLFLCPEQMNYRLAASSPCVDAGNGFVAPGTDLLGNPRFDAPMADSGVGYPVADLGAYEYVGKLEIVTCFLPVGKVGKRYSAPLSLQGGTPGAYAWSVTGSLPPGLGLVDAEGPEALIKCMTRKAGTFSFQLIVSDAAGNSHAKEFSILVVP